jgi:hypothetical protein
MSIIGKIKIGIGIGIIIILLGQCVTIGFMASRIKKLKHTIENKITEDKKGVIDEKADDSSDEFDDIRRKLKR